jgi:DNA polymerase V
VFVDLTEYLGLYRMTPRELVAHLIREILRETGITATGGIGSNLYLAKIAMDIQAKHAPADENGVRIAELDVTEYRRQLWDHRPLTDFWRIGRGIAQRLQRHGVTTMGQLARLSLTQEDSLYREFGVDAEILIDHAWGVEPCGMAEIKAFRPVDSSISVGQVLSEPYDCRRGRIIVQEMADQMAMELTARGLVTDGVGLAIGYDKTGASGLRADQIEQNRYGATVPKGANGSQGLVNRQGQRCFSASVRRVEQAALALYDRLVNPDWPIRRFYLSCSHVQPAGEAAAQEVQLDLFTSAEAVEADQAAEARDVRMQQALVDIRNRFGRNKILRGLSFQEGATARERNETIGGHAAGEGEDADTERW